MANNDHAMTRFLFAILQQKCLKDIDWNKVAQHPNLVQPITNGHAARMRYSRYRSQVLGIEPQRRNKVTKTSAAKKKKAGAASSTVKKEDGNKETEDTPANPDGPAATKKIKLERLSPEPQSSRVPTTTMATTSAIRSDTDIVKIKQERTAPSPPTTSTVSMPGTPIDTPHFSGMMQSHRQSPTPVTQPGYTMRLLTPCSDHQSPVSVQAQTSDVLMHHNLNQGFMTATPTHSSPLSNSHEFHHHHHHHGSQSQAQSPYDHHAHHFDTAVASGSSPWGHSHMSQSSPASASMYSPTTPAFGYALPTAAATNCDHAHSQHTQYSQQQQTQDEHNLGLMGIGMGLPMNSMNMNLGGMNMGQMDFNNMVMQAQRTSMSPPPAPPIKGEVNTSSPHWGTMDAGFV
ncbi:hypothetical protein QBC40DRAFT_291662 [Triangularia verruculosa]|uniref:Myb-like DNA-binding domain-containing protein n=1 Tax=Triangularia verruculosa TaxID=2587418 RepID=A0AAN6XS77_9PEZI|nr:hypothetical protein QBC40DRAFT_291662 [Triangularia verruculosa]